MIFELNAIEQDGRIIVSNPCWEVIHDPARGGCIQSIRFFHGRRLDVAARHTHQRTHISHAPIERGGRLVVAAHRPLLVQKHHRLAQAVGHSGPVKPRSLSRLG